MSKLPKYDGTGHWKSFYKQFQTYAYLHGWTDEEKINNLCLCLKDKALDFFVYQPPAVMYNFDLIVQKMEKRFGKKDLPQTLRLQFHQMKQKVDEGLEEWAERVQRLALEAYADLPDHFMTQEMIRKFCQGCADKDTAQYAADRNPATLEHALQIVKTHIENSKAIYGNRKPVRQLSLPEQNADYHQSIRSIQESEESAMYGGHLYTPTWCDSQTTSYVSNNYGSIDDLSVRRFT